MNDGTTIRIQGIRTLWAKGQKSPIKIFSFKKIGCRGPSGLAMHSQLDSWRFNRTLPPKGVKGPDTLYCNGNSIIHSGAAHAAPSFMWNRGPSGPPLP